MNYPSTIHCCYQLSCIQGKAPSYVCSFINPWTSSFYPQPSRPKLRPKQGPWLVPTMISALNLPLHCWQNMIYPIFMHDPLIIHSLSAVVCIPTIHHYTIYSKKISTHQLSIQYPVVLLPGVSCSHQKDPIQTINVKAPGIHKTYGGFRKWWYPHIFPWRRHAQLVIHGSFKAWNLLEIFVKLWNMRPRSYVCRFINQL